MTTRPHHWSGWPGAYCLNCGLEDRDEVDLSDGHRYSELPHDFEGDCAGCARTRDECRGKWEGTER